MLSQDWIVKNFNWSIKTNFMSIDYKLRKYEISYNNDLLIQSGWWYKGIFIYDRKMNRGLIKIVIALFTQTAANLLRRELYHLPSFQNQRQMWPPIRALNYYYWLREGRAWSDLINEGDLSIFFSFSNWLNFMTSSAGQRDPIGELVVRSCVWQKNTCI